MNYKDIVLEGFNTPSTRKNLKDYFVRKYRNAEKEHYSFDEFFDGLNDEIKYIEGKLEYEFQERVGNLAKALDKAEFEKNNDDIKKIEKAMKVINRDYCSFLNINYSQSQNIKEQIKEAMLSVQPKKKSKPSNIEPLDFNLNQSEVIYLFDILQEAGFIHAPKFHDGSYYRKLESNFTASKKPIKHAEQKRNKMKELQPLSSAQKIKDQLTEAIKKMYY